MTHSLFITESEEMEDHNESRNTSLTADKQMDNNIKSFEFDLKGYKVTRTRPSLWCNQMRLVATESSGIVSIINNE